MGDPFKDTSGPSMNILIKLTCLVGLAIAPILGSHGANSQGGDSRMLNNRNTPEYIEMRRQYNDQQQEQKRMQMQQGQQQPANTTEPAPAQK